MKFYCEKCKKAFPAEKHEGAAEVECPDCGTKVAVPQDDIGPGVVLGDFLVKNVIGYGGMGIVYLARQLSLDRDVALKILQKRYTDDKEYVESLFREARAAAKINHPNVVQAYAIGEDSGTFYFAMELVRGNTFKEILNERGGKLEFKEAAKVIRDIAHALGVAWKEQRLVHRDIKPDNIMLDSSGFAKLADLGLAQIANSAAAAENDSDEVLGTPQYISPEQLTGVATDVRSDIYSLGATFYQFVTGRYAYVAQSLNELPKLHVEGNLEPPVKVNPELPMELNDIIVKMMARFPENRYQTPEELVADLEKFLHAPAAPVTATAPGLPRLQQGKAGTGIPQLKMPGMKTAARSTAPGVRQGAKPAISLSIPGAKGAVKTAAQAEAATPPAPAKTAVPPTAAKPVVPPTAAKPVVPPAAAKTALPPTAAKPVVPPAAPVAAARAATPPGAPSAAAATPVSVAKPAADVAVKPATDNAQPAVKAPVQSQPKAKKGKGDKDSDENKKSPGIVAKIFKTIFLVIGIVLLLSIVFVVTVVVLKSNNKLPKFLAPVDRFFSSTAEKAKSRAIELAATKPAVEARTEAPVVTRAEYLKKVEELLKKQREGLSGAELLALFDAAYPMLSQYKTDEERQSFEKLLSRFAASDEELRCVISRERLRKSYRRKLSDAKLAVRRAQEEQERLLRLRQQQEEAARKREEELRRQNAAATQAAKVRIQKLQKSIVEEGQNVAAAMIEAIMAGNLEKLTEANYNAVNFAKYIIVETAEEKVMVDSLLTFVKSSVAEAKKLIIYKQRLENISARYAMYITLENNEMALVTSIRPGAITCLLSDNSKRTLVLNDLDEKSRVRFCNNLSKRFSQLPNSLFFIGVFDQYVDKVALKNRPAGFWTKYWIFFEPVLKK